MMAYQGLSLGDVFYLSCHLLPNTIVMATSWGFVVAMVWVYHRWSQEKAFDVMRSFGVSPWFFNQPTIFLSLILTGFLYALTLYWGPMTMKISRDQEQRIQKRFDPSFITAGVFFTLQDRTLYVHRQLDRYHLEGVFLHDRCDPKKEFILCGQSAYITPQDQGFLLHFQGGSMHVFPKDSPPYLVHFKSHTLHYTAPLSEKKIAQFLIKKPQELSLKTLWNHWERKPWGQGALDPKVNSDLKERKGQGKNGTRDRDRFLEKKKEFEGISQKSLEKELNYRLFWPMLPLLDALWIPPLMLRGGRWMERVLGVLWIIHGGILSPWSSLTLLLALGGRIIYGICQGNKDAS